MVISTDQVGEVRALRSEIAQRDVRILPFQREITTDWSQGRDRFVERKTFFCKSYSGQSYSVG